MTQKNSVEELFLTSCDDIFVALRSRKPVTKQQVNTMYTQLDEIICIYENSETVPKTIAACVFDMSTALYSAIEAYPGEAQQALFELFDEFCDRVHGLLYSP